MGVRTHPDVGAIGRMRRLTVTFPPKWGINSHNSHLRREKRRLKTLKTIRRTLFCTRL
jgi:hypothetical protein